MQRHAPLPEPFLLVFAPFVSLNALIDPVSLEKKKKRTFQKASLSLIGLLRLGHHLQAATVLLDSHHRDIIHLDFATNDLICQLVANLVGDQPVEWPCAKLRVVALVCEPRSDIV